MRIFLSQRIAQVSRSSVLLEWLPTYSNLASGQEIDAIERKDAFKSERTLPVIYFSGYSTGYSNRPTANRSDDCFPEREQGYLFGLRSTVVRVWSIIPASIYSYPIMGHSSHISILFTTRSLCTVRRHRGTRAMEHREKPLDDELCLVFEWVGEAPEHRRSSPTI